MLRQTSKALLFVSQLPKHNYFLPASHRISALKPSTFLHRNIRTQSKCITYTKPPSHLSLKPRGYSTTPNSELKPKRNIFRNFDASLRELGLSGPAYWFVVGTFCVIAFLESAFWAQLVYRKFWTMSEEEGEKGVLKEWAGWWGGWLGLGKGKEVKEE